MRVWTLTVVICAILAPLSNASGQPFPHYGIVDSVRVAYLAPGEGDHYIVDPHTRRLYGVGRYVLDIDRKAVADSFADTSVGGGFLLAPELGRGLVRTGLLFDLRTNRSIKQIPFDGDGSAYDPTTGRAFLFNDVTTVVDMRDGAIVGHPTIPGAKESAVADARGHVYENLATLDAIAVIDSHSLTMEATYHLPAQCMPAGLAIDVRHRRLFVGCNNVLVVLDADHGNTVAKVPMDGQSDQNAFDPTTQLVFMPNGPGKGLTIMHEDTPNSYTVVQVLRDSRLSSMHVVLDTKTHRIFAPHRFADEVLGFEILAPTSQTAAAAGGSR